MQSHEYDTLRNVEDRYWWYRILHEMVRRDLAARLPPEARILDAGCGTGGMLEVLHTRHPQWILTGIDTQDAAVAHCHERGFADVRRGDVGELPYATGSFEAVLSLDVLYHTAVDEGKALAEMIRVLKPGGVLVVNLPAFDCLRGTHDVAVCGARRYIACQVRRMLESRTLCIDMIHYWNAWLFLPLRMWRWWSHASAMRTDAATVSDLTMPTPWLNNVLTTIGGMDAFVCRSLRLPWGSSVFAIATKPPTRSCETQ